VERGNGGGPERESWGRPRHIKVFRPGRVRSIPTRSSTRTPSRLHALRRPSTRDDVHIPFRGDSIFPVLLATIPSSDRGRVGPMLEFSSGLRPARRRRVNRSLRVLRCISWHRDSRTKGWLSVPPPEKTIDDQWLVVRESEDGAPGRTRTNTSVRKPDFEGPHITYPICIRRTATVR
jgi:hypothetical protein